MWHQLVIHCTQKEFDDISDFLDETPALAVTLTDSQDNPILEPPIGTTPLWPELVVTVLFQDENSAYIVQHQLLEQFPHLSCSFERLPDQDWERTWMAEFKSQCFGQRLWVCPTWTTPPDPNATNLILDPGLAFGTGTHSTTSLCLKWLDKTDVRGKTMIDFGCGSGILALAALKLGAAHVTAVDIDPQALLATRNNAQTNSLDNHEILLIEKPEALSKPVDIILANILLNPLLTLAERFAQLLNEKGTLVVSGILREQADTLIEAYQHLFNHEETMTQDHWALLVFRRSLR